MKSTISSLSDSSVTIYFEQKINPEINDKVISANEWIKNNAFEGLIEIVPAYASITLFYDIFIVKSMCSQGQSAFDYVKSYVNTIPLESLENANRKRNVITIPVKYEGPDLGFMSEHLDYSIEKIIAIHTRPIYRVYMLGFLPGFAYLGGLDKRISMPRKKNPRFAIEKGSVGIAGLQTGIYPVQSPGGWQIIGKSEVDLFDINSNKLTFLEAGDYVRFESI